MGPELVLSLCAAIAGAAALAVALRSTPNRVLSRLRDTEAAALEAGTDASRLRAEWTGWKQTAEALLDEVAQATETMERRRKRVRAEADRAERAAGGGNGQLDPLAAKALELRQSGWNV